MKVNDMKIKGKKNILLLLQLFQIVQSNLKIGSDLVSCRI